MSVALRSERTRVWAEFYSRWQLHRRTLGALQRLLQPGRFYLRSCQLPRRGLTSCACVHVLPVQSRLASSRRRSSPAPTHKSTTRLPAAMTEQATVGTVALTVGKMGAGCASHALQR